MKLVIHKSLAIAAAAIALAACGERTQVPMPRADASPTAANLPSYVPSSLEGRPATAVMGAAAQTPAAQQAAYATTTPVTVDRMDDTQIVSSLRQQYSLDRDISAMVIDVDSKDGMVTLSGIVANVDARVRADQMARALKDVKSVNNQIEIKG